MTKHLLRNAPPNLVRGLNWRDLSTAKAFPGITCNSNIGSIHSQEVGSKMRGKEKY